MNVNDIEIGGFYYVRKDFSGELINLVIRVASINKETLILSGFVFCPERGISWNTVFENIPGILNPISLNELINKIDNRDGLTLLKEFSDMVCGMFFSTSGEFRTKYFEEKIKK